MLGLVVLLVCLTGCGSPPPAASTVTVTAQPSTSSSVATAATTSARPSPNNYSGNGTFAVGEPHGGLKVALKPGRYTAKLNDGEQSGAWVRCSDTMCGPSYPNNTIAAGFPHGVGYMEVVEVEPTDAAVYLLNVTFTQVLD